MTADVEQECVVFLCLRQAEEMKVGLIGTLVASLSHMQTTCQSVFTLTQLLEVCVSEI